MCGARNRILMVGRLKSSFSLNLSCFAILILRLDLDTMEWDEVGQMLVENFQVFSRIEQVEGVWWW